MPVTLQADDPRLTWQGAVSLETTGEWVMPWRIPYQEKGLFPPDDGLPGRAAMSAGVRIAFHSNTTEVAGGLVPNGEPGAIDLCCDGRFTAGAERAGKDGFRFANLPPGEKLIELWLPQMGEFRLKHLELTDGATVAPFEDTRPKWITYGSSITQCRTAESPSQTWPAIVARERGLNLTNLGFGGQCHLDPMVARVIRDLPADFISICCSINIYGGRSLSPRSFRPAIIGTVRTIREKHPATPLAVISPIISPPRETTPNAVNFTLQAMREEVADAVARLQAHGDVNVHYVNGLDLFGAELAHLLPDDVHPNAEGYKALGRNFLDKVIPRVFP